MIIRKNTPCMGGGGKSAKDLPFGWSEACLLRPESTPARPRPRLDLTFVYTAHCKSGINNMHSEKQVWISRASERLRIHTYKILSQ